MATKAPSMATKVPSPSSSSFKHVQFGLPIRKAHIAPKFQMTLRAEVVRRYGIDQPIPVTLVDTDEREFTTSFVIQKDGNRRLLKEGWRSFVEANALAVGDCCHVEVVDYKLPEGLKMLFYVMHDYEAEAARCEAEYAACHFDADADDDNDEDDDNGEDGDNYGGLGLDESDPIVIQ